jgi:hypothetical protein
VTPNVHKPTRNYLTPYRVSIDFRLALFIEEEEPKSATETLAKVASVSDKESATESHSLTVRGAGVGTLADLLDSFPEGYYSVCAPAASAAVRAYTASCQPSSGEFSEPAREISHASGSAPVTKSATEFVTESATESASESVTDAWVRLGPLLTPDQRMGFPFSTDPRYKLGRVGEGSK